MVRYLYLYTLSTGCNVLYLVFKSNIRQTIKYLYLTPNKVLRSTIKYRKKHLSLYLITCLEISHILTFVLKSFLKVLVSTTKST